MRKNIGSVLRILMVTTEDPGHHESGSGEFVRQITHALGSHGHQVRIVLLDYSEELDEASTLVDYHLHCHPLYPTSTPEGAVLESGFSLLSSILPILQDFSPHIIHCNDRQTYMPFHGMPNVVFSLHLSMPDLRGLSGLDAQWFEELKIDRCALQNSALTFVYSGFTRKRVWASISPEARPIIMPLGTHPPSNIVSHKPRQNPRVISFFGRLNQYQKGLDDYLRGVALFSRTWPALAEGLEFRAYGHGSPPPGADHSIVQFMGFVGDEQREPAYLETDIVVMPSRYETFGLVGLEALNHACLLLAPRGLGMDEYFRPGMNGLAIQAESHCIAETLQHVISNWAAMEPLIRQGVKDASCWTWSRAAREHIRMYKAVLKGLSSNVQIVSGIDSCSIHSGNITSIPPGHPAGVRLLQIISQLLPWIDNDQPLLIWGTGQNDDVLLERFPEYTFALPNRCASLETLEVYHPHLSQLCIIGWLEYTINLELVLDRLNHSKISTLIIGILEGKRLPGQRWSFDSPQEVCSLLPNYIHISTKTVSDTNILIFSLPIANPIKNPGLGQRNTKEEELYEVLQISAAT